MKALIIGGTGLLGSAAARELIRHGHTVSAVALPPAPREAPPDMEITFGNYLKMTDGELLKLLNGCEGFVFAAGVDERVEGPPPIYDLFKKYNVTPLARLLRLAKQSGVKRAVVCGSYFSYFDKLWTELELSKRHPYIRSRRDQEKAALAFAGDDFAVSVLELPYIFGAQPGRTPVWMFLVKYLRAMKLFTLYPRGGSAMMTVKQAGQAVAGALTRGTGGACYPLGYENLTWRQLLKIMHRHMGCPHKPIVTIPDFLFAAVGRGMKRRQEAAGLQSGLDLSQFSALQCRKQFIDKSLGCEPLGVQPDDLDQAICQSVRLCLDVLDGRAKTVEMKGE
ncbi:MAG: NAD(P)H-binding protein [Clostridiales bacterium]|nr:NAD(P)H-binding protein [Clostridiales bacterium]